MTIKKAGRLGVKDEVVGAGCHESIPRFAVCILNHWTSFQCAMHTRPGTPKIQPITKHHSKKKNPSAHPMCRAYKATANSLVLAIIVSVSSLSRLICCHHPTSSKVRDPGPPPHAKVSTTQDVEIRNITPHLQPSPLLCLIASALILGGIIGCCSDRLTLCVM